MLLKRSWRYIPPLLVKAPDELIGEIGYAISWWLMKLAPSFEGNQRVFFDLCDRILGIPHQDGMSSDNPVARAINHPVGLIAKALLLWWYRDELRDDIGLSEELKPIFTRLSDPSHDEFWHARVILASHLVALFRVDREWTMQNLLPLFDWQASSEEARAAWSGFLRSPQLYIPLFEQIKSEFLDTANHFSELGQFRDPYAALLTYSALEATDIFKFEELRSATNVMHEENLIVVISTLVQLLESAREQRQNFWQHRIRPYFENVWPRSEEFKTVGISQALANLCIAADVAFPKALETLRRWLQPIKGYHLLIDRLLPPVSTVSIDNHRTGLVTQFPGEVLDFLYRIVHTDDRLVPKGLEECLRIIQSENPELAKESSFRHLEKFCEMHNR